MKKLKTIFVVMLCAAILLPAARPLDAAGIAPTGGSLLSDIYTDKAMYHPCLLYTSWLSAGNFLATKTGLPKPTRRPRAFCGNTKAALRKTGGKCFGRF